MSARRTLTRLVDLDDWDAEGLDRFAPQLAALVAPYQPLMANSLSAFGAANEARGQRVLVPRTGTLVDLHAYVGASAGNVNAGVFSTADPRVALWTSGSIACPAAGWAKLGDPNVAVTAGDALDFVLAASSTSASFARFVTAANNLARLPTGFLAADGAGPVLAWFKASSFDLAAATFFDASITNSQSPFLLIARVA